MAYSRLHVPDDDNDRHEPQYSPDVGTAIAKAYTAIRAGDFAAAEMRILPWLSVAMTPMQHIRVLYLRGLIASHRHHDAQALQYADEALDMALSRDALDAVTTLAVLGATAQHNLQLFAGAAHYYAVALDALGAQEHGAAVDPLTHFDVLDGLASESFLIGRYNASRRFLRAARRIPLPGTGHEKRLAGLEWTLALLARWRGDGYRALEHVRSAMNKYIVHGHPIEQARLSSLLADIILDLALPPPSLAVSLPLESALDSALSGDRLLMMAEPYILRALGISATEQDRAGEGLALLAYARFLRAGGHDDEALRAIATVESFALQLHDAPLLAQVHTARGEAFAARGDRDAARLCFAATLDTLRHSDARAYTARARRVLLLETESGAESEPQSNE
jgi:tetratricopeptide (TPR) repeat protein